MTYVVSRVEKEAPDGNVYLIAIDPLGWHWKAKPNEGLSFATKAVAEGIANAWNARPASTDLAFVDEAE